MIAPEGLIFPVAQFDAVDAVAHDLISGFLKHIRIGVFGLCCLQRVVSLKSTQLNPYPCTDSGCENGSRKDSDGDPASAFSFSVSALYSSRSRTFAPFSCSSLFFRPFSFPLCSFRTYFLPPFRPQFDSALVYHIFLYFGRYIFCPAYMRSSTAIWFSSQISFTLLIVP